MAIFGVGSSWDGEDQTERFFREGKFILGWNQDNANDLYAFVASLKMGDILYIKANQPGSRKIRVKGVGIVKKNFMGCITSGEYKGLPVSDWKSLFVHVAWVYQREFPIDIPEDEGKLTNIRAATIYEEHLPLVQEMIVDAILAKTSHE